MPLELTSSAFSHGGEIPVLIVDAPDAPDPAAPKTTCVHQVLCNIPVGATFPGVRPGASGTGRESGPCPAW